jgi:UDP-glucose 4-epimerase
VGGERGLKIAVTGASGHLGQQVVAALTKRGDEVLTLGRRAAAQPTTLGVEWSCPVRPVVVDLSVADAMPTLRDVLSDVDAVVHLSAYIPPDTARNNAEDAERTLLTNAAGSAAIVAALQALQRPVPVAYASTFEVYGEPVALPIAEEHREAPLSYYGASKLAGENYLHLHSRITGAPCSALRLPAIYGPGDAIRRAIGNFLRAVVAGQPIEIHGDGEDLRELVYVADAADAVVRAVDRRASGVFNVASGRGYSIRELAESVIRVSGSGRIVWRERSKPRRDYVLAIERARERLGWNPRTTLDDGLRAQLKWLRATAGAQDSHGDSRA